MTADEPAKWLALPIHPACLYTSTARTKYKSHRVHSTFTTMKLNKDSFTLQKNGELNNYVARSNTVDYFL